jgi:hypothetical protein
MAARKDPDTEMLLAQAAADDRKARDRLLERFRPPPRLDSQPRPHPGRQLDEYLAEVERRVKGMTS